MRMLRVRWMIQVVLRRGNVKDNSGSISKTKHQAQFYHKECVCDPFFQWMVTAFQRQPLKARCHDSNTQFTAKGTVLKNHTKSKKHQGKAICLVPVQTN